MKEKAPKPKSKRFTAKDRRIKKFLLHILRIDVERGVLEDIEKMYEEMYGNENPYAWPRHTLDLYVRRVLGDAPSGEYLAGSIVRKMISENKRHRNDENGRSVVYSLSAIALIATQWPRMLKTQPFP